eukprot:5435515-Alexandrium_andersonii.AAC.1
MYNSKCAIGLQAAASSFDRFLAVSCAPSPRWLPPPPERERRKLLEAARNCWNPLEPAGTAEDPPLRTLRC